MARTATDGLAEQEYDMMQRKTLLALFAAPLVLLALPAQAALPTDRLPISVFT